MQGSYSFWYCPSNVFIVVLFVNLTRLESSGKRESCLNIRLTEGESIWAFSGLLIYVGGSNPLGAVLLLDIYSQEVWERQLDMSLKCKSIMASSVASASVLSSRLLPWIPTLIFLHERLQSASQIIHFLPNLALVSVLSQQKRAN